ncbi:transglutaminase family protein [Novacetimonas pomaceti]|nr:transglutaminase family protein [Novacetimonas pomaceti]
MPSSCTTCLHESDPVMTCHVTLVHRTSYRYDRPVFLGPQTIRLRPDAACRTPIVSYEMDILPSGHRRTWRQDDFGNHEARVTFEDRVTRFDIAIRLTADLSPINPFDLSLCETGRRWPVTYTPAQARGLAAFMAPLPAGPHLRAFLAEVARLEHGGTLDRLVAINRLVAARIAYRTRMEAGVWSAEETLGQRTGSCRDSAWLLIQVLRHMGMAARFVSGYLIQDGADGTTGDLHAWVETWLPGAGWVGFDTTSGLLTSQGHIALAAAVRPDQVAPVTGMLDNCTATLDVSMTIHHPVDADVKKDSRT